MSGLPGMRSKRERWARAAGWLAAAAVLAGLGWTAGEGLDHAAAARLVRAVGIGLSAVLAVLVPHVLFPDPHRGALQLANPDGRQLMTRQILRWVPIPLALAAVPAVAAGGGALAVEGALAVLAVGAFALARVVGLGERVQRWESAKAGGWYRALYTWAPPLHFQVPEPLVPGLLVTGEIFLMGSAVAVAGQAGGSAWGIAATAMLAVVSGALLLRHLPTADRAFWTSNGVWADAFRQTDAADARQAIQHDAVYWAPRSLRPTVWAGLVSLDRRFPLGRVAAVALALVAGTRLAGASAGVQVAALGVYLVAVNGPVALTADALVPGPLAMRIGGVGRWAAARFWMNARWLPPLVAVGLLLAWLTDLPLGTVAVWAAVYLGVAALSAGLATVLARR